MTKQENAHASLVEVDSEAVGAFIGRYVLLPHTALFVFMWV